MGLTLSEWVTLYPLLLATSWHVSIGSLSNYDDDVDDNFKKQ